MKKLIILLLTLTLILGIFSSCGKRYLTVDDESSSSPSEDTTQETNDMGTVATIELTQDTLEITSETQVPESQEAYYYTIKEVDGKYYMVWNDYKYIEPPTYTIFSNIYYSSFNDLKKDLENRTLSSRTIRQLLEFYVRPENYNQLPICDIDHFWQPVLPDGWEYPTEFEWRVDSYRFHIPNPISPRLFITPITEEEYNAKLTEFEKSTFMNMDLESFFEFFKADIMPIRKLQNGEKTAYLLKEGFTSSLNSWIILFTNGDYWGCVYGDSYTLKDLTDEQILSFGFEEYLG